MIELEIEVRGLDKLQAAIKRAPSVVRDRLNDAVRASVFEVLRYADDSGNSKLFQFKTPRALRTGWLSLSFRHGIQYSDLQGSVGPIAIYAPYVHKFNPFMRRIAEAAKPEIQKHFERSVELVVRDLEK